MLAAFNAALILVSVAASQLHHINPEALHDPLLRQLYLRRLAALRHQPHLRKRASLVHTVPASLLPGHHPLVEKALTDGELRDLKQKQSAVNVAQGKLRGTVSDALMHMNDVARIKHAIAQKQAQLRNQKHKTNVLQDDVNQIERTHSQLVRSLHESMDPKVDLAKARMKKKQTDLQNEEDATRYWGDQEEKVKTEANEAIKDGEAAQKRFTELQGQFAWSKQQERIAEKKFEYDHQMAQEEVQSLRYAQGQYDSEMLRLKAAGEAEEKVELALQGEDNIRAMEQVEDARRTVRTEEDEAQNWKDNVQHINAQASETIKQNNTSYENLLEVRAQVAWTKQEQDLAQKQYKLKRSMASQEVSNLKYVETKYEAEASKLKAATAAATAAAESVQKLDAIRSMEEHKVQHHLAIGKHKLQNKIEEFQAAREETSREIDALERQYAEWQEDQQQRNQQVAQFEHESTAASQAYSARQQDAFTKAQAKVYEDDLLRSSDDVWDGEWANEG